MVLSGGLGSSVQAACRKTNESVYPAVDGVHWKKKLGSSHRYSKEKNKSPGNSRQLTDYFVTREGTEEEILKGQVDSLFMRCFFVIVFQWTVVPN